MDLISIVIPCYNVAPYLQKCVESIAKQTYKNLEVIFVNDGSTDNTLAMLNELTKSGGGIKYFLKKTKAFRQQEMLA